MSAIFRLDRPPFGRRATLVGAAVLTAYVFQLGVGILHIADEHHTLAPDDHGNHQAPHEDNQAPSGPSHDGHSVSDHLDAATCRRTQIDDVPVLACERAPEVEFPAPFMPHQELESDSPANAAPSPGPPSRAPPAA